MTVVSGELKPPRRTRDEISPGNMNRLQAEDRAAHDWYRFVLSFPRTNYASTRKIVWGGHSRTLTATVMIQPHFRGSFPWI